MKHRESASRLAYYLIHILALLIRLSLAMGVSTYLPIIIRQPVPCSCTDTIQYFARNATTRAEELVFQAQSYPLTIPNDRTSYWGMPSNQVLLTTVLFCHVMQRWSIPLGFAVWALIVPVSALFSGYYSLGQVLAGILPGLILHIYFTKTPLVMRIVDGFVHGIAGILCLFLFKNLTSMQVEFSNAAAMYLESVLWFCFAWFILFSVFSPGFLKMVLIRRNLYSLKSIDIQFMSFMDLVPDRTDLLDAIKSHDSDNFEENLMQQRLVTNQNSTADNQFVFTRFYNHKRLFHVIVALMFVTLCVIQFFKYFADDILTFFRYYY